jgi:hypothetical protein
MDDSEIRTLVARLGRPHGSGGIVVERAAILAEGADFNAVMTWITEHAGTAETRADVTPKGGLHSARADDRGARHSETPLRFVLPPGALA